MDSRLNRYLVHYASYHVWDERNFDIEYRIYYSTPNAGVVHLA